MSDTSTPSSFLLGPDQLPDADLRCRVDTAALRTALRRSHTASTTGTGILSNVRVELDQGQLKVAGYDRDRLVIAAVLTRPWDQERPGAVSFDPERALAALRRQRGTDTIFTAAGPAVAIATAGTVTSFARAPHQDYPGLPRPALSAGPAHKRGRIPREVLDAMERASRVVPRGRGYARVGLRLSIGDGFAEITAGCADVTTRQIVDLGGCGGAPGDLEATIDAAHWATLARAGTDLEGPWQISVGTDDHGVVWLNLLHDIDTGERVRLHVRHLFDPVEPPNLNGFDQGPQRRQGAAFSRDRDTLASRLRSLGTAFPAAKLHPGACNDRTIPTALVQRATATLPRGFVSVRLREDRLEFAAGGVQTVAALPTA